jgi:hypothetical protein
MLFWMLLRNSAAQAQKHPKAPPRGPTGAQKGPKGSRGLPRGYRQPNFVGVNMRGSFSQGQQVMPCGNRPLAIALRQALPAVVYKQAHNYVYIYKIKREGEREKTNRMVCG